jgi:hypothetical protein
MQISISDLTEGIALSKGRLVAGISNEERNEILGDIEKAEKTKKQLEKDVVEANTVYARLNAQ